MPPKKRSRGRPSLPGSAKVIQLRESVYSLSVEGKENWYGLRQHYRQCVCSCIAPRMELEIPGRLFRGENIWLICKLEILRSVCKRSHLYKSYNWGALKWINFGQHWLFVYILFFSENRWQCLLPKADCTHYWHEVSTLYWGIDERAISSC